MFEQNKLAQRSSSGKVSNIKQEKNALFMVVQMAEWYITEVRSRHRCKLIRTFKCW